MSVMRNFKDRVRTMGSNATTIPLIPGPDVEAIKSIVQRTGYQMEITVGQRKYHCPPGNLTEPVGSDHEVMSFVISKSIKIQNLRSTLDKFLVIFMKTNLFHYLKILDKFGIFEL